MRKFFYLTLYVACAFFVGICGYRLANIYLAEKAELDMLKQKEAQMMKGLTLDASWVARARSCDAQKSVEKLNELGSSYDSFGLVSVQPQAKKACENNYTLADPNSALDCYPLELVWTSTFLDGVNFMKAYQKSCMFLFKKIKINVINYPLTQWEISGWTVHKSEQ